MERETFDVKVNCNFNSHKRREKFWILSWTAVLSYIKRSINIAGVILVKECHQIQKEVEGAGVGQANILSHRPISETNKKQVSETAE